MPWHIGDHADCNGFAVIKDGDGSAAGCHETEEKAKAQMAALYAAEENVTEDRAEYETGSTTNDSYMTGALEELGRLTWRLQRELDRVREAYFPVHNPYAETEDTSELRESATGHAIDIEEAVPGPPLTGAAAESVPLALNVVLIEPGPGNAQDGHFYPADVLRRDAGVFEGAKMFATDHRQDQKDVGTWVSTVQKCPIGFTETGGPIARVIIHKPWFAKDVRTLKQADLLPKMECSIIGTGKAKRGKIEEIEYSIVESISDGGADWVTRAGAGGRALEIAESDSGGENVTKKETEIEEVADEAKVVTLREDETETDTEQPEVETEAQDTEPEAAQTEDETEAEDDETEEEHDALAAESVNGLLAESGLGADAITLLAARPYQTEQDVSTAIEEMTAFVKRLTGSGQPFAQGATAPVAVQERTEKERIVAYRGLKEKWGSGYVYEVEE